MSTFPFIYYVVMSVPCTFLSLAMSACLQYMCTQPVCSTGVHKLVYSRGVHKTSLQYSCTQNQFTVQVYTKLVYSIGVPKPILHYSFTQTSL